MPTNHEKFLAGEPVTVELEALRQGQIPGTADALRDFLIHPLGSQLEGADKPLTAQDRAALREMRTGPGWPILQRLLERSTIQHTKRATLLSEDDPLGNQTGIAQAWHTLKTWKALHLTMNLMVETELQKDRLEQEEVRNGKGS